MSVFDEKRDDLEKHEVMFGIPRGRLAVALDSLTDALILAGQHGVYCRSNRNPSLPATDIQAVQKSLQDAKELVSSVMEELRKVRDAERKTE
ncbi:MAG TPA: hypothetical protein VMZ25_00805 [Terriglobales bacterium]|nr:hypothetical protein [Terriglobales bacterium]